MPRMRFLPGLVLGLIAGLFLGAAAATFILPPRSENSVTPVQLEQLTRQLESTQREREALVRQVDDFRGLADRMTASFMELERRFKAMEEELRARDTRERAKAVAPPPVEAAPPQAPPPEAPSAP